MLYISRQPKLCCLERYFIHYYRTEEANQLDRLKNKDWNDIETNVNRNQRM